MIGRNDYSPPRAGQHDRFDGYQSHFQPDNRGASASEQFVFRGASAHTIHPRDDEKHLNRWEDSRRPRDTYRPQEQFTFRSQGPSAPRFPSPDRESFRPRGPDNSRAKPYQRGEHGRARRNQGPRFPFKRAANNREILNKSLRDTTPEQLEGMNGKGLNRFNVDLYRTEDSDCESESSNPIPSKKRKSQVVTEHKIPEWSNPDPYTALPPPETLGAPKRDIVDVIRKAKIDPSNKKGNSGMDTQEADFISFNFDDDTGDDKSSVRTNNNVDEIIEAKYDKQFARAEQNSSEINAQNNQASAQKTLSVVQTDEVMAAAGIIGAAQSNKRKRGPGGPTGDVLDSWHSEQVDRAPWCSKLLSSAMDPALRLHMEICDFYDFVKPAVYEDAVRRRLVSDIEDVIRRSGLPQGQTVTVKCFGSFAAGLYLPTADMDLVAVTPSFMNRGSATFCQSKSLLRRLGSALQRLARPGDLCVIASARVPIVKFTDRRSGIKVDMSVENRTGLDAVSTFEHWKRAYPAMPIIVVIIKQLLAMRGLNEVFKGGIGGFTIICLVTSMLQLMPEHQSGTTNSCTSFGDLLLRFLDLYGNKFDIHRTGICMNPPGYFDKRSHPMPKQNDDRLTIMDPNNPSNDISGGSRLIDTVFATFREAHAKLQRRMADVRIGSTTQTSILDAILGGNYDTFEKQRAQLRYVHDQPDANLLSGPRPGGRGYARPERHDRHNEQSHASRIRHDRFESKPHGFRRTR